MAELRFLAMPDRAHTVGGKAPQPGRRLVLASLARFRALRLPRVGCFPVERWQTDVPVQLARQLEWERV
eukprot:3633214-Prorocentrum_lima.AAC.1